MSAADPLAQFVRDALIAGRSRADIRAALTDSGWSSGEIDGALTAFADTPFLPPVPRPQLRLTARDAFIYLLLFTALGMTTWHLVSLIFSTLDLLLPDPTDGSFLERSASDRIRWAIAALFVSMPAFVWMTLYTERKMLRDPGHQRSLVRKWLTYTALFLSAVCFAGVIVYVLYSFLKGEITLRFILKALTVAAIAGATFFFYLRGLEDFQDEH